jgi:hypothetical protein
MPLLLSRKGVPSLNGATPYCAQERGTPVHHNAVWMAYLGVAALHCIVTKKRLGYRSKTSLS